MCPCGKMLFNLPIPSLLPIYTHFYRIDPSTQPFNTTHKPNRTHTKKEKYPEKCRYSQYSSMRTAPHRNIQALRFGCLNVSIVWFGALNACSIALSIYSCLNIMCTFFRRTFDLNSIYFPFELKTTRSQTLFYILHYATHHTIECLQFEYIFFQTKKICRTKSHRIDHITILN